MPIFQGSLNTNKIYNGTIANALFNMIISQRVFDINVTPNTKLLDLVKDEVAGFGDKKLYYFTDVLKSEDFLAGIDSTNQNVLATHRPKKVTVQELVVDTVRQINLTVDDFLIKQAFTEEGGFATLMSVFMSAMEKTKQIHLSSLVNSFIGTDVNATATRAVETITVSGTTSEEKGGEIAEGLANLLTELGDLSREFTDTAYLRSFDTSQLTIVWNAKYVNMIQKRVLPYIFGSDKLTAGIKFNQVVLPARFFGTVSSATSSVQGARTLKEIEVSDTNYFPGDVLPTGTTVAAKTTYTNDADIICKIIGTDGVKMLTCYNTTESFRNARAHNTNYYMCFGYSTPEHLVDYPVLTVKVA